jgi:hypothetical protein
VSRQHIATGRAVAHLHYICFDAALAGRGVSEHGSAGGGTEGREGTHHRDGTRTQWEEARTVWLY